MLKYSCSKLNIFSVIKTEFLKAPRYISYVVNEKARAHADSVSKTIEFLKGRNLNHDQATAEKQKKHKEMYEAILREKSFKLKGEREKYKAEIRKLSFKERLKAHWKDLRQTMQEATSTKVGVMTLLQHCAASHAAEIAVEEGMDVKDVQFVLEKQQTPNSVTQETTVVGYIDAPNASEEEFAMFVERLQKACPVANRMTIEWRNRSSSERDRQMEDPSQWPNVESASPYQYNLRGEARSHLDGDAIKFDKSSSHSRHEDMPFRDPIDFQASHKETKKVERDVGESEHREDRANHTTEPELSNQTKQKQRESDAHAPHGTPGEHRMHSTGSNVKNSSCSNYEQIPSSNEGRK